MKQFILTATICMEAQNRESLIDQLEIAKREIRDNSGIARGLLDSAEVDPDDWCLHNFNEGICETCGDVQVPNTKLIGKEEEIKRIRERATGNEQNLER